MNQECTGGVTKNGLKRMSSYDSEKSATVWCSATSLIIRGRRGERRPSLSQSRKRGDCHNDFARERFVTKGGREGNSLVCTTDWGELNQGKVRDSFGGNGGADVMGISWNQKKD